MIPVRNNEDIIEEVIEYLISQGLELVVLDNGSTDNTYEICEKYVGRGILKLSNYKSETFRVSINLRMLYDMALVHTPDWVVNCNSDEFLESGINSMTLSESIKQIDQERRQECHRHLPQQARTSHQGQHLLRHHQGFLPRDCCGAAGFAPAPPERLRFLSVQARVD